MSLKSFALSKADYSEAVKWLEENLSEMKATQEEILTAELLMEENFLRLAAASGDEKNFSALLSLRKRLGDVNLTLAAKGKPFNPIVEMDETTEDETEMFSLALLKAHHDEMSYVRKREENIVTILVHEAAGKQPRIMVCSMILGILLGIALKNYASPETLLWVSKNLLDPVQTLVMNGVMMVVGPLIFFSVLTGFCGISDAADLARYGGKLVLVSLAKMSVLLAAAMAIGIWMGSLPEFLPLLSEFGGEASSYSIRDVILGIVPNNIVSPFSTDNFMQVLFLACFFGMLLAKSGERAAWVKETVLFFHSFLRDAIGTIMPLMPLIVMITMAKLMMRTDPSVLLIYGKIFGSVILILLNCILVSVVFVAVVGRISPIPYLRKTMDFLPLALSFPSTSTYLPQTMEFCSKKLGVEESLVLFSIPLGIQFNKNGPGPYLVIVALLMRSTLGLPIDADFLLSFFFALLIITFTIPSAPGSHILVLASVFELVGVPSAAVALFVGLGPIKSYFLSSSNALGNIVSTFLLARLEDKVDETIYFEENN